MAVLYNHPQVDLMMARAKEIVFAESPRVFYITRNFKVVYVDSMKHIACVTKKASGEFLMLFNPKIIIEQGPQFGAEEFSIIIFHEMWHLVLGHLHWLEAKAELFNEYLRQCKELGINPDKKNIQHVIANRAMDYIVNASIPALVRKMGYYLEGNGGKLFANICLQSQIENIPDVKAFLDSGKKLNEFPLQDLYDILIKHEESKPKKEDKGKEKGSGESGDDSDDQEQGQTMDGHEPDMSEEDKKELGDMSAPQSDDVEKMVEKALNEGDEKSSGGDKPDNSGLRMVLQQYQKIKSDREAVVQIQKFYKSAASEQTQDSYAIRNRKYGYKSAGQEVLAESTCGIIWDTSLSTYNETFIGKALSYIDMAKRYVDNVMVVTGDTELKDVYKLRGKRVKAEDFNIAGRGGSDMNFGPVALKKYRPDFLIVITDGDISPFNNLGIPTIFFIPKGGTPVPGYKCFFLE